MKLTLGEMHLILNTLAQSLRYADWVGFSHETRENMLSKLNNDQSLMFNVSIEEKDGSKEKEA